MKYVDSDGEYFAAQLTKYAEHLAERETILKPPTMWQLPDTLEWEDVCQTIAEEVTRQRDQLNTLQRQFNELHEVVLTLIDLMIEAGHRG